VEEKLRDGGIKSNEKVPAICSRQNDLKRNVDPKVRSVGMEREKDRDGASR